MGDITRTAAKVAPVFPDEAEMFPAILAATVASGQLGYYTSAGKIDLADGNGSGTTAPAGLAMDAGGAGQATNLLRRGHVYGWDLSGMAYWDPVYMSNTAGELSTTAGGTSVVVGRVVPLSDNGNLTKVLFIDMDWS